MQKFLGKARILHSLLWECMADGAMNPSVVSRLFPRKFPDTSRLLVQRGAETLRCPGACSSELDAGGSRCLCPGVIPL